MVNKDKNKGSRKDNIDDIDELRDDINSRIDALFDEDQDTINQEEKIISNNEEYLISPSLINKENNKKEIKDDNTKEKIENKNKETSKLTSETSDIIAKLNNRGKKKNSIKDLIHKKSKDNSNSAFKAKEIEKADKDIRKKIERDLKEGTKKVNKKLNSRPTGSKLTFVLAIIMSIVVFFLAICACGAFYFAHKLCEGMPEFDAAVLESADSSIIYDSEGNQIIELGMYLRENIEYEELPNCLVDAFVSIEDSRFFEHFGFDIPRFTKAIIANLKSGSFEQGGSTITMQLIKNSYFQVDNGSDSTTAARQGMSGIQRKMQEIVLAIEANGQLSKQETLVLYLNKVNFGDNIRGVQKAAEYYFGKDARELTLNESAFLAGIINAPNSYNPYNDLYKDNDAYIYLSSEIEYLENANEKKNEVLDLMLYHGYITEEECELNKNVKIENLVYGKSSKFQSTNAYYQSYIDAVIDEAERVTGKSPYTTAMNIYTSMDAHMQSYVYDMQNNPEKINKYVFRHENQQNALVVMNNQTGELIALGGGRNQADEARQFNRAVDSRINPGSTIKPVLEYCLAFDRLGYATSHTVTDQPVFLYWTDILITNAYGQGYSGDMLITEALARSLNTPAIQLLEEVIDKTSEEEVIEYCQSIGFDSCNKDTFDLQWAIGGRDCTVSPVQLAAAHGMLMHGGKYIAPHTIQRIEYRSKYSEEEDYVADTEGTQVVSTAAAYMTAYCENYNVTSGWIPQLNLLKRDYPTYAKTGTSNFSEEAYEYYNIPETAAKDQWLCCQTSNYTIVVWNGFDQLSENKTYFTVDDENYNLKCKMGSVLLDELMNHFNYDAKALEQPDDCVEIQHIKGCFPYATGTSAKGLISKNSPYYPTVAESEIEKEVVKGEFLGMSISDNGDGTATVHWGGFHSYGDGTQDLSATSHSGKKTIIAYGRAYYQRYRFTRPDMFYATVTNSNGETFSVESSEVTTVVEAGVGPYSVCGWTSWSEAQKCANQGENITVDESIPDAEDE